MPHCIGPCHSYYRCSSPVMFFANLCIVYLIASVVYMATTRHVGTPFSDSLTAEQRDIKATSARLRKRAFVRGVVVGLLVILVARPFHVAA